MPVAAHSAVDLTIAARESDRTDEAAEPVLSGDDRCGIALAPRELRPPLLSEAAALFEDGQTVREVAVVLRISKRGGTASAAGSGGAASRS